MGTDHPPSVSHFVDKTRHPSLNSEAYTRAHVHTRTHTHARTRTQTNTQTQTHARARVRYATHMRSHDPLAALQCACVVVTYRVRRPFLSVSLRSVSQRDFLFGGLCCPHTHSLTSTLNTQRYLLTHVVDNLQHENDGLIFTPNNMTYRPGTTYEILKWKPKHLNSIDFILDLCYRGHDAQPR